MSVPISSILVTICQWCAEFCTRIVDWNGRNSADAALDKQLAERRHRRTTGGRTIGSVFGMAKDKISVTVDASVLAAADADARAAGLNRSEMIEQALRNEHLRVALQNYTNRTVPALDIDAYAQKVYDRNRAAGL